MKILNIMLKRNDPSALWSIAENRSRGAGEAEVRVDCGPAALVTIPNFCTKKNHPMETVKEEGTRGLYIEEEEDS